MPERPRPCLLLLAPLSSRCTSNDRPWRLAGCSCNRQLEGLAVVEHQLGGRVLQVLLGLLEQGYHPGERAHFDRLLSEVGDAIRLDLVGQQLSPLSLLGRQVAILPELSDQ